MATYDLAYPGAAIDAILNTAYFLQEAGYIFQGSASEYSGTPSKRVWLIAPAGSTGFGLSSAVPQGSFGICLYNGTSWVGKIINVATIDSAPTQNSGNAVSSGGAYAAINQLSASVTEALENLTFTDTTPSAFQDEYINMKVSTTEGGVERILTYLTILAATTSKAGLLSAADKVKIDSFLTNLRSLTFADTTASADQGTKITETLKATIGGVQEVIDSITLLAATSSKAGLLSAADKAKIDALWSSGYQFAGIATPSTTPISTTSKIFYIATEAGTYFNAVTVTQGINILSWDGTTWSAVQVVGIDNSPVEGSSGLVESGGVATCLERKDYQQTPVVNKILSPVATTNGYICNDNGTVSSASGWNILEYTIVRDNLYMLTAEVVNTRSHIVFYYDSSNVFLGYDKYEGGGDGSTVFSGVPLNVPEGATKMKVNVYSTRPKTVVKSLGDDYKDIFIKSKVSVSGTLTENKKIAVLTGALEDSTEASHYNVYSFSVNPNKEYLLDARLRSTASVFAVFYDGNGNHICDDVYYGDNSSVTMIENAYLHIPPTAAMLKVNAYSNLPAPSLYELGAEIDSNELKAKIDAMRAGSLMENVVLPTQVVPEVLADYADGSIDTASGWNVFEYDIEGNTMYAVDATLVNTSQRLALYYDADDMFIGADIYKGSGSGNTVFSNAILNVPANAKKIRLNVIQTRPNTVMKTLGEDSANEAIREKTPVTGTLVENKRIDTLRGTLSDSTGTSHYNVYEYAVSSLKQYVLTASLRSTSSIFCAYYDSNDDYLCDDIYHGDGSAVYKITNALLHIPADAVTLRVNAYSNLPEPLLRELGDEIDSNTLKEKVETSGNSGFAPILLKGRPYYAHYNIINANHPTIDENTIIAPSQSLFDIEVCARLGFTAIELNVHETSDHKFVCFHGTANKFNAQFSLTDNPTGLFATTEDFTTLYVSEVTLADIKASLVNKAKYAKYRTPPCTLEECLLECRRWGIMPLVTFNAKTQPIIDSIMGKSDYIGYIGGQGSISPELRALTSSMLVVFDNTTESVDDVIANCDALGGCVLYCAAKIDSKDESVVIDYVEKMHKKGYFVAGIPFDRNEASNQKYLRCNYDGLCSAWDINRLEHGNICELGADMDFSDFTHNGTVSGGVLTLANGNTIAPNFTIPSVFLGGAYLELKFTGTLTVQMGDKINETITSSGEKIITFSSSFFESAPTFLITSSGSTTITGIQFKASKL